ncbi:hypothetical protein AYI69_g8009 [Smittium culicis]|uniref:Uncharacterized protein n=1 Tax=Smittium culicis TaxID=133412 RepID=A0A1R1XMX0_9FUNG|nr:hypothetical protein AYI69_g8009 [Smittium culicis]
MIGSNDDRGANDVTVRVEDEADLRKFGVFLDTAEFRGKIRVSIDISSRDGISSRNGISSSVGSTGAGDVPVEREFSAVDFVAGHEPINEIDDLLLGERTGRRAVSTTAAASGRQAGGQRLLLLPPPLVHVRQRLRAHVDERIDERVEFEVFADKRIDQLQLTKAVLARRVVPVVQIAADRHIAAAPCSYGELLVAVLLDRRPDALHFRLAHRHEPEVPPFEEHEINALLEPGDLCWLALAQQFQRLHRQCHVYRARIAPELYQPVVRVLCCIVQLVQVADIHIISAERYRLVPQPRQLIDKVAAYRRLAAALWARQSYNESAPFAAATTLGLVRIASF